MYQIEYYDFAVIYSVFVYFLQSSGCIWKDVCVTCNMCSVGDMCPWNAITKRIIHLHYVLHCSRKKQDQPEIFIYGTIIEMIVRRAYVIYGNPTSPARTCFSRNLKRTGCFLFVTLALDNRSLNPFSIDARTDSAVVLVCNRIQMEKLLLVP